jgi:hypothetical protein
MFVMGKDGVVLVDFREMYNRDTNNKDRTVVISKSIS